MDVRLQRDGIHAVYHLERDLSTILDRLMLAVQFSAQTKDNHHDRHVSISLVSALNGGPALHCETGSKIVSDYIYMRTIFLY